MINWVNLLHLLGLWILGLGASQVAALGVAFGLGDAGLLPLAQSTAVTLLSGTALALLFRPQRREISHREGVLAVVIAWIVVGALGALPFWFSPYFSSFTDALFESVSGFTTTGASILSDVEAVPGSLLFWRSLTHWLGGMGIILLMLAILPLIGTGGMELYRAEFSGARSEKLKPRVAETALALWRIYIAFSIAGYLALRLAGMGPLDAACHMFGALGTGGFSTRNASVGAYQSLSVELIVVALMVIGGLSFTLHYQLLVEGRWRTFLRDSEMRWYLGLLGGGTLLMTLSISGIYSPGEALRRALFQVTSIMTATGFSSADFGQWNSFAQLLLLALMFAGGCTGSTAGGLKIARVVLLVRVISRQFRSMAEPRAVFSVQFSQKSIREETISSLLNMVYLALLVNFGASLVLTATGSDIVTAISAVASAMFNVGPGLARVGPAANYGHLAPLAKWTLTFCMLAGRLEFYSFLVVLTPAFWRK